MGTVVIAIHSDPWELVMKGDETRIMGPCANLEFNCETFSHFILGLAKQTLKDKLKVQTFFLFN